MTTATTRATPVLLWSRAALLAAVVLLASVVGHVSADGRLPGPATMLVLLAATTALSARFLTRPASAPRIVAMLVAGQAGVHTALSLLAGHGEQAATPTGAASAGAGFVFDGRQVERTGSYFDQVAAMQASQATSAGGPAPTEPAAGTLGHLVEHLAAQGVAMMLAHLAVVALLGVWIAAGERALWTVLALTTSRVLRAVGQVTAVVLGLARAVLLERVRRAPYLLATGRLAVPLPHLLHHVVAHRGPPVLLLRA